MRIAADRNATSASCDIDLLAVYSLAILPKCGVDTDLVTANKFAIDNHRSIDKRTATSIDCAGAINGHTHTLLAHKLSVAMFALDLLMADSANVDERIARFNKRFVKLRWCDLDFA